MTQKDYEAQLNAWYKARFAPPPEPPLTPTLPTRVEMVPMRDGVKLYTEIFLPAASNKHFPVVLMRSPYPYSRPSRNDKKPLDRYLDAGYAVVFQLTRGQYQSEGIFRYLLDDLNDGHDCIDWLAGQPWSNGQVGMEGPSYLGATQLLAARTKPPALKCIMPTAFVGSPFTTFPYIGGIPFHGVLMQWHQLVDADKLSALDAAYGDMRILDHPDWGPALRRRPILDAAASILTGDKLASWREMLSHPLDNDYWRPIRFTDEDFIELDLPMFFTDGWYDLTIGPVDYFSRLERLQPKRSDRYLLVGPWNHGQTYAAHTHDQDNGARKMPDNGAADLIGQRLAFYDRYLKDDADSVVQTDRVRVYITGANVWKDYPTFPVPGMELRRLYLHSDGDARSFPGDGMLDREVPNDEPVDNYIYDPDLPTPCVPNIGDYLTDLRAIEIRADVLVYTSAPLDAPITILGEISLNLYAATDGPDTDWFATLTEVFPDGRSIPFHCAVGALRARYRQGFEQAVLLIPNKPTEFCISLGPAGHQVAAGNRLRLSICSACFPMFSANTNTGNDTAIDTDRRITKQTVFHDAARPSHLVIPVINNITI